MPRKYPQEFQDCAVRLVSDRLAGEDRPSRFQAIREVVPKLGVANETLRRWVNQAQVDSGTRPGVSTGEREEIRKLKREVAELRRANEILKTASAFFAAELDRPIAR